MARKKYTPEDIIRMLREAEVELANGQTTTAVLKKLAITPNTYYRWRQEYGGLKIDQARRLKDLERENDPERGGPTGRSTPIFPPGPKHRAGASRGSGAPVAPTGRVGRADARESPPWPHGARAWPRGAVWGAGWRTGPRGAPRPHELPALPTPWRPRANARRERGPRRATRP